MGAQVHFQLKAWCVLHSSNTKLDFADLLHCFVNLWQPQTRFVLYRTKMSQRHSCHKIFISISIVGKYDIIVGNMTAVASFFIVFLSLLIYQHFGPRKNKTLLRFVTDYLREYGLSKNKRFRFDSPSMDFNNPTYFCRQSVTNI